MKKGLLGALILLAGTGFAQSVPPKFQGADVQRFMARLSGEAEKVALESEVPAKELSPLVVARFTVDTAGAVTGWRYLDSTCQGRDFRDADPASPRTKEVLETALGRLERWTPAREDGRAVPYTATIRLRIPVEKIAKKQDGDPLLFLGEDPDKSFHKWAVPHFRYHGNREMAAEGRLSVTFRIEVDGSITILETSDFPDPKYTADVVRVIKKSKGRWTPRKREGMPVASIYKYNVYCFAE